MKTALTLLVLLLLSCTTTQVDPAITPQQVSCLNKDKEYVQRLITSNQQTFYGKDDDIYLFKTSDDQLVGYIFEQGECTYVLTEIALDEIDKAETYIAAKQKKNYGKLFVTDQNVHYELGVLKTQQDSRAYLSAGSLN